MSSQPSSTPRSLSRQFTRGLLGTPCLSTYLVSGLGSPRYQPTTPSQAPNNSLTQAIGEVSGPSFCEYSANSSDNGDRPSRANALAEKPCPGCWVLPVSVQTWHSRQLGASEREREYYHTLRDWDRMQPLLSDDGAEETQLALPSVNNLKLKIEAEVALSQCGTRPIFEARHFSLQRAYWKKNAKSIKDAIIHIAPNVPLQAAPSHSAYPMCRVALSTERKLEVGLADSRAAVCWQDFL
ncbi:hypothetical protein NM208_g12920 [Fusarium decemcellulare]|uniref:Uncharacterized protein n=1 Tax=Fusarium decemcellulare TaxID=57161 RepID=A0ACC1RLS2_9HYPO|nr:hypothetical protein NM208_g12920 [Fusarium decemcellulare]